MATELATPPPETKKPQSTSSWKRFCYLALFLLPLLLRLPQAMGKDGMMWDELIFSIPTLRDMEAGGFPIYATNAAYMAPVQEWITLGLFHLFGESYLTFRLPCLLFACLAVPISFWTLRRAIAPTAALGIALVIAAGNSAHYGLTVFSYPTWGLGICLVALMQAVTVWVDQRRTPGRWIAFGLVCGASLYIFKLTQVQMLVSLPWLFFRSETFTAFTRVLAQDSAGKKRVRVALVAAAVGCLPLSLSAYHYLTRIKTFKASPIDLAVVALGLVLIAPAAWEFARRMKISRRAWKHATLAGAALLLASQPPMLYFDHVVRPRTEQSQREVWDAARYTLKHAHQWPGSASVWMEEVLPSMFLGGVDRLPSGERTSVSFGWRAGVSVALTAAMIIAVWQTLRRSPWSFTQRRWLIAAPFVVLTLFLLPSWRLASGWSFRYLLPFAPGLFVLIHIATRNWLVRHPWLPALAAIALAIHGAIDGFFNTPGPNYPRRAERIMDEPIPEEWFRSPERAH